MGGINVVGRAGGSGARNTIDLIYSSNNLTKEVKLNYLTKTNQCVVFEQGFESKSKPNNRCDNTLLSIAAESTIQGHIELSKFILSNKMHSGVTFVVLLLY